MMKIRKSEERGHANHGWLDSYHTFSFANYYDAEHMAFRSLRVINEDYVQPSRGFGTHPHQNMEIITYVLEGSLEHKDSMGNGSIIKPGDVQRMSAGTGVTHSEFNPSSSEQVHLLQIWIMPKENGILPSYEQAYFDESEKRGKLRLIASSTGQEGSVTIHADAKIYAGLVNQHEQVSYQLDLSRHAWVHVVRGNVHINQQELKAGDAAAISEEREIIIKGLDQAEVLVFDLA